jgi:hypothetical protein
MKSKNYMKKSIVVLVIERNRKRRQKCYIPTANLAAAYEEVVRQKLYQRQPDKFVLEVEDLAINQMMLEEAFRAEAEEIFKLPNLM